MEALLYISGPSCSGKTTLRTCIARTYTVDTHVVGDDHWLRFPDQVFNERVRLSNVSIAEAVNMASGHLIVCEWVPIVGEFPTELKRICAVRGMLFLQVALNADSSILRQRKMLRDGDGETNQSEVESLVSDRACLILDSGKNDVGAMCSRACEWLANTVPKWKAQR